MLTEFDNVRQIPGEPRRRLFSSNYFHLYVWYDEAGAFCGFQLCYDISGNERALSLIKGKFVHAGIDGGEFSPRSNMTPILVRDGSFQHAAVLERFKNEALGLEDDIRDYVIEKIEEYSRQHGAL